MSGAIPPVHNRLPCTERKNFTMTFCLGVLQVVVFGVVSDFVSLVGTIFTPPFLLIPKCTYRKLFIVSFSSVAGYTMGTRLKWRDNK
jgi:hypothetical protein